MVDSIMRRLGSFTPRYGRIPESSPALYTEVSGDKLGLGGVSFSFCLASLTPTRGSILPISWHLDLAKRAACSLAR